MNPATLGPRRSRKTVLNDYCRFDLIFYNLLMSYQVSMIMSSILLDIYCLILLHIEDCLMDLLNWKNIHTFLFNMIFPCEKRRMFIIVESSIHILQFYNLPILPISFDNPIY